jgi:hypothetical protein
MGAGKDIDGILQQKLKDRPNKEQNLGKQIESESVDFLRPSW